MTGVLTVLVVGITVVTLAAGAWLGIPVLSWLYDLELAPYRGVMLVLIGAGGFNAVSILFYYALMVMRKQKQIFTGYTISFIVSIIAPVCLVKYVGIMGAAAAYMLVMLVLTMLFGVMLVWDLKRAVKKA